VARHVIVVGGGLAGLAAAFELRRRGARAVVLEREAAYGGRAGGERRDGFCLERSPQWIGAGDRALLGLIRDAGLEDRLLPLRPARLTLFDGAALCRIDPADTRGVARLPGVRLHQALRLRRLGRLERRFTALLDPRAPERAVRLDDRSAADFTRLYFGRSVLDGWVAPWLEADLLADAEETSRVAFWLHHRARGAGPAGVPRAGLGLLAAALAGPDDRTGARVREVAPGATGGVRVHVETAGGVGTLDADAAVIALPAPDALAVAAPLLATPERDVLRRVRYAPSIALAAALERAPLRAATRVWVPARAGGPIASLVVEPGSAISRAPEGGALAIAVARPAFARAHAGAPDDAVAKEFIAALDRIVPGAGAAVHTSAIHRHAAALPCFDVGHVRALARFRRVGDDLRAGGRPVAFAGDWLVAPTLEGAVISGLRAAAELTGGDVG
jgi:protoporphyrinogen oxidase